MWEFCVADSSFPAGKVGEDGCLGGGGEVYIRVRMYWLGGRGLI